MIIIYIHTNTMKYNKLETPFKLCRKDIPNMRYGEFEHLMLTQPRYMQGGSRYKMTYYEI